MKLIEQQCFTGERALFKSEDLHLVRSIFADGESPLKESQNIDLEQSIFKWKYPLWYCHNIKVNNSTLLEMARSGIWYTDTISITNSTIEAPKTFRRAKNITLKSVHMPHASETLWNCNTIKLDEVTVAGDYFGMNSQNITVNNFNLVGNYAFDGGKNIEIHNAKMLSKDAFWNCENVTVYDSVIIGEYLCWNSKNITFINCLIESDQGMCYADHLVMKNCRLINTDLSFEYSTVDAEIRSTIDSVKNPTSGTIRAKGIDELIMDETKIDPTKTQIILDKVGDKRCPTISHH